MLGLASAIIVRNRHAALQYLLTNIARCRSVGMETAARRSERAFGEAIMLGSGNTTIVQASSWSCLTPPHLEPKRYPLQNVSNLSGGWRRLPLTSSRCLQPYSSAGQYLETCPVRFGCI